jgi:hypothetical protein
LTAQKITHLRQQLLGWWQWWFLHHTLRGSVTGLHHIFQSTCVMIYFKIDLFQNLELFQNN